jgi:hypothetical protein
MEAMASILSHITMNDLDHIFNDLLAVASQGQSAQFVFNEVGHQATHRSASGRYSLKKDCAIEIFSQGTLNSGDGGTYRSSSGKCG